MKPLSGLFLFLLVAACTAPRKTVQEYTPLEPLTVTAKPLPPQRYNPAAPRVWDILHTTIHISFKWQKKLASGIADLTLTPYATPQTRVLLDAQSMEVHSVEYFGHRANRSSPPTYLPHFQQAGDTLVIDLGGEAVAPADTLQLRIIYTAKPYAQEAKGSAAIREARGLYFINTDYRTPGKPAQIWTQGETEANSHWFPTIDKPNERFTTDISITVPDSFVTLSNGVLVSSEKSGGERTDHWKMDKPIQPYAVMMAIGKYSIVEDTKWRGRTVNYYVEPEFAPYAKQIFRHTPEMIEYFSRVTGVPYPWPKYSQVIVRDFVSGAMENTSASTFGEFMNRDARALLDGNGEDVVSHELFHQWFGDYATAESWANLTVNESFATYGEVLWRRYKYGDDEADEMRYDDLQRYLSSTERKDPPLVRFNYENKEDMFDRVSYQKGGAILHSMHRLMGDSAFSRAMKIYLTKNALQPTEAHHWRIAVEEATGRDWSPFFNQWYFRGGHPALEVTYDYNDSVGRLRVFTAQAQRDSNFNYYLPMKAALISGGKAEMLDWTVQKRRDTFEYAYRANIRPVFLPDADHRLVGTLNDKRGDALADQWPVIYTAVPDFITRRQALTAVKSKPRSAPGKAVYNAALNGKNATLRTYALTLLGGVKDSATRADYREAVLRIARADSSTAARAAALNALGTWSDDAGLRLAAAALDDSSYTVAGTALLVLDKLEESGKKGSTAYAAARRLLPTVKRGELLGATLTVVANYGKPEDTALFTRQPGREISSMGLTTRLARFGARTADSNTFKTVLRQMQTAVRVEKEAGDRQIQTGSLFQLAALLNSKVPKEAGLSEEAITRRRDLVKETIAAIIAAEGDAGVKEQLQNSYKTAFPERVD